MQQPDLNDAVVELTGPEGKVYRFRYGATIPYAEQDYVVLLEMEDTPSGEEQILVTRVEEENGELSFVVAEEEDVIQNVFDKYVALTLNAAVEGLHDCECGCHEHDCDCHDHDCGCQSHEGGCHCGE